MTMNFYHIKDPPVILIFNFKPTFKDKFPRFPAYFFSHCTVNLSRVVPLSLLLFDIVILYECLSAFIYGFQPWHGTEGVRRSM